MENFDLINTLAELTAADGVSGCEEMVANLGARLLSKYGDTEINSSGSVMCNVGVHSDDKPTLLLDAHIDEIGMIVTYITDDGFLQLSPCGGIDQRVLPASQVTVFGKEKITGVITSVPPHLQTEHEKAADISDLYADIGLDGEAAKRLVSLGDRVLIENPLARMGGLLTAKAIDDRSCAAAILWALQMIDGKNTAYNIKVLFSSQEEVGLRGAKTAAFASGADLALAVDVSFGRAHGELPEQTAEIGKGAMIGISPTLSRRFSNALIALAEEEGIPYQLEIMGGKTGTNADVFSTCAEGMAACTLSVPIRYMHTPVEAVSADDIESAARLIAAFCERGDV